MGSSINDDNTMMRLVEVTRQVLLVEKNNAEAMYYMGLFFEKGIGVEPHKESAFYYIEYAARLGYDPALTKLGDYYYSGFHVHKNLEFAKSLYEKAAQKNNSQALVNLGVMIEKGLDREETSPNRAADYYEEAAKMGNTNAVLIMGLKEKQSVSNSKFVQRAAEMGNIDAVKILTTQDTLIPKKMKDKTNYEHALQKMSTFYVKQGSNNSSMRKTFL